MKANDVQQFPLQELAEVVAVRDRWLMARVRWVLGVGPEQNLDHEQQLIPLLFQVPNVRPLRQFAVIRLVLALAQVNQQVDQLWVHWEWLVRRCCRESRASHRSWHRSTAANPANAVPSAIGQAAV